jgi:hypothetical protein
MRGMPVSVNTCLMSVIGAGVYNLIWNESGLAPAIREARLRWRSPRMLVVCPCEGPSVRAVRTSHGPRCSGCGALIDQSPSHAITTAC